MPPAPALSAPSAPQAGPEREESAATAAKRRQILEGARRAFFAAGFEAASMGDIARAAGVSKGTLYVYFDSKEALFTALVEETKRQSAEQRAPLRTDGPDVAATLTAFAADLIQRMTQPDHLRMVRMVLGVAERLPGPARSLYEAGPRHGAALVAAYLADLGAAGRMEIADPARAAWLFLAMVVHPVITRVGLGGEPAPDRAEAEALAADAVAVFLAAHPLRG